MRLEQRSSVRQQIRDARVEQNMRQTYVANRLGITSGEVSRVESGARHLEAPNLEALQEVIKIQPARRLRFMFEGLRWPEEIIEPMLEAPTLLTIHDIPEIDPATRQDSYPTFQDLLRHYIANSNFHTQAAIARAAGIDPGFLTHLLQNEKKAKKTIPNVAVALQVPTDELAQFYATAQYSPPVVHAAIHAHRVAIGLDRVHFPITP